MLAPFWVGLFCRMLHTLATGAVWSKTASFAWARGALAPACELVGIRTVGEALDALLQ